MREVHHRHQPEDQRQADGHEHEDPAQHQAREGLGGEGRQRDVGHAATQLGRVPLLRARALELLVGGEPGDDLEEAPLALHLLGRPDLEDPEVLERLVVAGPPPLLALVVVVLAVLPQRARHLVRVGGLGELDAARDFLDAAVAVAGVRVGRLVELLGERLDVALGLRDGVGQLVAEVGAAVDVLEDLGPALLRVVEEVERLGDLRLLLQAEADRLLQERHVVGARRDGVDGLRLRGLDLRQVGGELGLAERVRGAARGWSRPAW